MRISDLSSGQDINKLKALLQAGVITNDDLNNANISGSFGPVQGTQNALTSLANPGPQSDPTIGSAMGPGHELYRSPGETDAPLAPQEKLIQDALAAQNGDQNAASRIQSAMSQGVQAQNYGDLPQGNNFVKNEQTGQVIYLTPQGQSNAPGYGAVIPRQIPVTGYVGENRVQMPAQMVGQVNVDYSQPPFQIGGAKAYYSKDEPGVAYVMKDGVPVQKVMLRDQSAQLAFNKAQGAQDLQQAQLQHENMATAGEAERIRASKVNNPDVTTMGSGTPINMSLTGTAFLQQLDPMVAREVQAIGDGKTPFNPRSQRQMNLLGLVQQYNPDWNATDYQAKQATTKDFATGGKSGQVVQAINQALHHAATVSDAIDQLNNTNVAPSIINPVVNAFEQHVMGDTRQGNFSTAAMALSEELKKIYAGGGGGSLAELQHWQQSFDPNAGQAQQRAYLAQGMNLLQGAIESRQEAYKRGMGPSADFGKLFTPQAMEALQKLQSKGYIGGAPVSQSSAPASQAAPSRYPNIGDVQKGYRYKGGDPANPSSWEKA